MYWVLDLKKLSSLLGLALVSVGALAQPCGSMVNLNEARKRLPELRGLSDESAINVIHQVYYPTMDKAELAKCLGVALPPPPPPKPKLGPIDKWRYESCQKEAAQAPTPQGVNIGMRLCREKFEQ